MLRNTLSSMFAVGAFASSLYASNVANVACADDSPPKAISGSKQPQTPGAPKVPGGRAAGSTSIPATSPSEIKKADDEVNHGASKANEEIVGSETQRKNERDARDPALRTKDGEVAPKEAAKVGKTTTTGADTFSTVVADTTRATDKPGSYKPFAVEVNPLGLFLGGRFSVQAEWAPVTHHAVMVNPHIIRTSHDVATGLNDTANQTFTGVGGELGYRYYSGNRGMNGIFVGPALILGAYNASVAGQDKAFVDVGVAVDVGVKTIIADSVALGGGVGLEYLNVSQDFGDLPSSASAIASTGFKPRLILEAGYAF